MKRYLVLVVWIMGVSSVGGQVMYPGDTNNDGVANYLDLLPIGIAFGVEGEPRPLASENWFAQPFILWAYNLPTTPWVNGGFINANGDALIDTLDLDAIVANYDMMQDTAMPIPWQHNITCFTCPPPVLSISYDKDSVKVNESFQAFISVLYPETIPPDIGALGLGVELNYDPDLVVESSVEVIPNTGEETLMFVTATSVDAFGYRLPSPGRLQLAAAGRGQNAFFKDATLVATVSFIVVDDIQRDTVFRAFKLDVSELLFLNLQEELLIPLLQNQDSVVLYQDLDPVTEAPLAGLLEIFPNPADGFIQVSSPQMMELTTLRLWNAQGVLVREMNPGAGASWTFPVEDIPPGVYWLEALGEEEKWVRKLILR
ncbi:MAG: T9SS type A sorting domain-containing protein [Saprospirales bacterium]|nr:T9SS type A sorting domain-containing protein [Saprospirales bacterium]